MSGGTDALPLLDAVDLSVRFGDTIAVDGVSLQLAAGDIVAIVGANGCGKSSLLRALAGVAVDARVGGTCRFPHATGDLARSRAFVPQRPEVSAPFTAAEVVRLGRFACGADEKAVARAIQAVGLTKRAELPMHHLSGGERQRVAVARALAQVDGNPSAVLLLDEPFGGIDPGEVARLVAVLRGHAQSGAVALSLHDPGLARAIATRAIVLRGGRVVASGAAREVLTPSVLSEAYGCEMLAAADWLVPNFHCAVADAADRMRPR